MKELGLTKEEIYEFFINSKSYKELGEKVGYKDRRSVKKLIKRLNFNEEEMGKMVGGKFGATLKEGMIFGLLTVVDPNNYKISGETASKCLCQCGNFTIVKNDFLKRGHTTSCGCKVGHDPQNKIENGQLFGDMQVIQAYCQTSANHSYSLCKCIKCGEERMMEHGYLRSTTSSYCDVALGSKTEVKFASFLKENNIPYQTQIKFSDLKGFRGKALRFDFGILDNQGKIIALVEINGEQHYKEVNKFDKTCFDLKLRQEYDRKKISYCLAKNIPLIIIPYWVMRSKLKKEDIFTNEEYRPKTPNHNQEVYEKHNDLVEVKK